MNKKTPRRKRATKTKSAQQPGAAYTFEDVGEDVERHTFAVLVANEPGVLARVIGLFSGRGYNIESLTVAAVEEDESLSRISIVTTGTRMIIDQIRHQLDRLVPVSEVRDLTEEGPFVEREVALVKVIARSKSHERRESLRIAEIFGATPVDTTTRSFVFAMTGSPEKVSAFTDLMRELGEVEVARSGVVAIARGAKSL